ncbi:MAG: helix-turn-helix domain-containing protein [Actinobacteria bacterium]|nr:helix-turn-helix domain-containing protein [Actinomycetota bacterium]
MRDLGGFIREQRHHDRISLRKLSELAGISNPYLSQIERGLRKPSAEILQSIARGLQISAETLYVRAGILDEHEEADLAEHISRDPHLNDRQKQTLLEIYSSFRSERAEAPAVSEASEGTAGSAGSGDVEPVTEPEDAAESAPITLLPASLRAVL